MSIKKNIFAPSTTGRGATRRAAMTLLVMLLTATTAWADNINVATADGFGTLTDGKYTLVNGNTYTLTEDVNTAGYIYVPEGVTATIDLNGHTIDRGLTNAITNGMVIWVAGSLTVTDSGTGGKIKGGMDSSADHVSCVKVYSDNGSPTFTLQGGTLIGNTSYQFNHAVCAPNSSNITISGGKITDDVFGIESNGHVTVTGGEISGNTYGIYSTNYSVSVSGNPVITNNTSANVQLYSDGASVLTIAGELTDGANIGITIGGARPTDNAPVTVTSGYGTYNNNVSPSTYFSLDNNGQIQTSPTDYMTVVMGWNEDRTEIAVGTALYTVNFNMNGHGDDIDAVSVLSGCKVLEPTAPTADGWYFVGWYTDDACTSQWNFNNAVTSNMTLHALWTQEAIYSFTLPEKMVIVSTTNALVGGKYPVGTVIKFKVSSADYVVDGDVSYGTNTLTPDGDGIYTVTMGDADITITATIKKAIEPNKTLSGSESYTANDGDVLTGSTSGTVTIANNAKITLSDVTITGSIVCNGTAEITLVGTNSVSNTWYSSAGIQIGGSGTTLTIKGNGSLNATGGSAAAGIGLGRTWDANSTGGSVVIEGGTVTASGGNGIGTGTVGNSMTARMDGIIIKGGTVNARLGKGTINYGSSVTIGTIKIYDGIEKVDASAITESVTYMHVDGNTETDVTASASTYFTITEDGDRRVIVPKDNTDYTITIADGIEHGTLTGAATAKYMENVTITATPDFGYRLSRLVVKDAQNNNVESTGNSFFMPKSNVTVSAVFEQGTHGTTEFTWFYTTGPQPQDQVLETIYDGVTTVNIQQTERSYYIRKYEEYTYCNFRLDNDTYNADIPYAGGTGEFYKLGNPTNFVVPYDGETGYYDITMTDVGNGKWSVSILKTVGVIDNIPDQTYSGSEITPEPLVIAGSLSLTKGTDYVYSYTNNTDAGTAKVIATFQGDYESLGSVEKEFTILPSTVVVNVTGNGTVTYNDKVATNGEVIGVVADKGTDVTLTLAPESGYAVSIEYGYTNNSGETAIGAKLPISGTTATLTVPNDLKDGTYVNLTVTFVSALAGGADEASAVALTDNTVTNFAGGWYKVDSNITFGHTLNLLGDTHLIIDDGKTMTVNTASGKAIDSEYTLNVSGEGALNITTTEAYKIAVRVGSYVQTGATVTASGYIGIRCTDDFIAFNFDNDFTFSGGQLTATGNSEGIWADNDITLSCTNATDFILASSYSSRYGAVKIADGKALTDGTEASNGMNGYSGTLTNEQRTAIGGKTLHRAVTTSYVEASGTLHENVIAIPLDNTMTTLAAGWYVVNENVDYTGKITLGDDVNIILADGKTMTASGNNHGIYGDGPLTIYGQALGTGILTVTSISDVGIRVVDGVTINGGTVNATGIYSDGNVTINGGKVTSTSDPGIYSNNGTIILGLSNATDYITAESYNGAVKVADGQTLVDDGGNIYTGTLTSEQITAIAGKTLRPVMGVVLTKDGSGNISAEFDGTSLETVSIPVNITVNSVTLNRTFTHDKCATLMLPFSLSDGQSLNGGILYKFDGVNNGEGDWVATLSEFTSPLKANTPYLIKPNGHMTDDKITFDLNGGTVTLNTTTAGEDSNEKDDLWDFIGTYSYIKWTSDTGDQDYSTEREAEIGKVYGFAAVEKTGIHVGDFVRVASGAKIRPMCAYLKWKGSVPNNARALTRGAAATDEELPQSITVRLVGSNGETTAIGTLDTKTGEMTFDSEAWYTLDGVRLSGKPSKKGLYINNGKKIVIK